MKDIPNTQTVQADFDRIALLSDEQWSHNIHYHPFLLHYMPTDCEYALEVGCGTGRFARTLAQHAQHVLALDLSPQMIRVARERSAQYPNIDFRCSDIMTEELANEQFDYVVSIATLHHLPLEEVLWKIKRSLKVGGTLAVLDLFQSEGLPDYLSSLIAMPISIMLRLFKNNRMRPSPEERAAWQEHVKHDVYMKFSEVRAICSAILPGAHVRKHLFWRYSIVWRRPELV